MNRAYWSVACMTGAIISFGELIGAVRHVGAASALCTLVVLFVAAVVIHPGQP